MIEFLKANWSDILSHIAQHFWLVFISIAIAIAIGLPLGILITRSKRLRAPVLGIANVMQTIPSLALFGFLIPLPFIGGIGPRTAIVALVFYALLPIIRNTVTGILGVDASVREAAVAMGMTDRQVLFQVELPLAMSVILTGVRVAVVITIGVAIIAAEVGAGGLGEYIFRGLRMDDSRLLLAGAAPSAAMALVADFGFSLIEKHFDPTTLKKVSIGGLVVSGLSGLAAVKVAFDVNFSIVISQWFISALALLIWSFKRDRRWWQGVAAWFGGGLTGNVIGWLLLTTRSPGPQAGGFLVVLCGFSLFGVVLLWLGFRTWKSRQGRIAAVTTLTIGVIILGSYAGWRALRAQNQVALSHGHVTVGSKDFTESVLLAEIVAQMLEGKNIEVDRRFDLGGNLSHGALVAGQIDVYPEYTGTSFTQILHHPPISDPRAVYDQVKREYAEQFIVEVSPPLGFENTFAILVRGEDARHLNLKTISDAAKYTPQWRTGFGHDFISRADGYPGFSRTYGLNFAETPREMALDLTYAALASHKVDLIAGNSTDGRIAALDLFQLEDDRRYFPPYEAVFLTRKDALVRVPALAEVLQKLGGAISTDEMRKLNYEVDGAKRDKKNVIHEWLIKKGLIN